VLDELDAKGLIAWSAIGNPRKIVYADEMPFKKLQGIWRFKDPPRPSYPTEVARKVRQLVFVQIPASTQQEPSYIEAGIILAIEPNGCVTHRITLLKVLLILSLFCCALPPLSFPTPIGERWLF